MTTKKPLGGPRLATGEKMNVELSHYNRSNHNLSKIWRSTMAPGTIVPFMNLVGLPGDRFDIELDIDALTLPTVAPLFGRFKIEAFVFECPMDIYNRELYMNATGTGLKTGTVKLPVHELIGFQLNGTEPMELQQVHPSSIFAYNGMMGLGWGSTLVPGTNIVTRRVQALKWLSYWDIVKNYLTNKQEGVGWVIHNDLEPVNAVVSVAKVYDNVGVNQINEEQTVPPTTPFLAFLS